MIRIAICEDEAHFRDTLFNLINKYLQLAGEEYTIDTYENGEQLLEAEDASYAIVCLDVEIKDGISGIELSKILRKQDSTSQIIFVTSHQEEAYKAFEVEAFRYLIKPIQESALFQALDAVLKKIKTLQKQKILFRAGNNFVQLQIGEILYIETVGRKIKICTLQKDYLVDNKIKELEGQLLEHDFFRVHKSYLVHFPFIKEHTNPIITMQNGNQIFISRLRLKLFKKQFLCYLRRENSGGYC